MKLETLAIHGGYQPEPTTKAVAVPIYQTTSYAFDDTQHGADLFDLKVPGNVSLILLPPYSPESNPVENLWHFLRAHHWSNRPYRDSKDLENEAVRSMRKVCLDEKENLKNICNAPYVMKRA